MKDKFSVNSTCPCGSGIKYKKCCQPFHKGKNPKNALELMRSRYSAFAAFQTQYIIQTTHKDNNDYSLDIENWTKDILQFSKNYDFHKLDIIEFIDGDHIAYVTFKASISSNQEDKSFTEKSTFIKENNIWQYKSGIFLENL